MIPAVNAQMIWMTLNCDNGLRKLRQLTDSQFTPIIASEPKTHRMDSAAGATTGLGNKKSSQNSRFTAIENHSLSVCHERKEMDLIKKLEQLIKPSLSEFQQSDLDLTDDDSYERKYYFDYLGEEKTKEALLMFPNGESLYEKHQNIATLSKNRSSSRTSNCAMS